MKKILTVSLFAIMAVGAANADIASTDFVKGQTGSEVAFKAGDFSGVASTATNLKGAVDAITGSLGAVESGKTVVDMIEAAQADATYDDTEVRGLIGDNADAIAAIEESDYAKSGATKAKIDAIATNTTNIGKNTDAIAAINNETTGVLAQAKKYADDNDADTIYDETAVVNRLTAIETSDYATSGATKAKIDAIATNTTNIGKNTDAIAAINNETTGVLAQAKKYADDNDADTIYDETAVVNRLTAIETSDYATSGATKAKIDAIATNTTNIGKNTDAIAAINNETTGILAEAKKHTDEQLETLSGDVAAFESALGGKQDKSAATDGDYVLGGQNGAWQSIKSLPAYCGTGHCALVSNDGTIEWEKVQ